MGTKNEDEDEGIGGARSRASRTDGGVDPVSVPTDKGGIVAPVLGINGHLKDRVGADGVGPDFEFELDYTDQRGRRWGGTFKGRVLTVKDRISLGLTKAQLSAGMSPGAIDPATDFLLEIVAHMTVALNSCPEWAKVPLNIYDQGVLGKIYEEVSLKEARFHSPNTDTSSDVDGGGAE